MSIHEFFQCKYGAKKLLYVTADATRDARSDFRLVEYALFDQSGIGSRLVHFDASGSVMFDPILFRLN